MRKEEIMGEIERKVLAGKADEIDTFNSQMVSVRGQGDRMQIAIQRPKMEMTPREALVLAAYLVALADRDGEFPKILEAVQNA